MSRTWTSMVFIVLCLLPIAAMATFRTARASPALGIYDVAVNHYVQIRDGGSLIINDTIRLSTELGGIVEPLKGYIFGFPNPYQANLNYAFAYDAADPSTKLQLELNVGMERTGLYGINVIFPQDVDISDGGIYEFTVVFVFTHTITSRSIQEEETQLIIYNATFPAYPSLLQNASAVDLTIAFPTGLDYSRSSFENQGVNFTRTSSGTQQFFNYTKNNLAALSDESGWFSTTKGTTSFQLLDVNEARRSMQLSGPDLIAVSDSYAIVAKAEQLAALELTLPKGAFDISASTEVGIIPSANLKITQEAAFTSVDVTFAFAFAKDEDARFQVDYQLPWKDYIETRSWEDFDASLTLFENTNWTVRNLIVTVALPEGAVLTTTPSSVGSSSVENGLFGCSLTFSLENATIFHDRRFSFTYQRAVLWESFRPTLWMGSLVTIASVIAAVWSFRRPVAAPLPTGIAPIRAEDLKGFVDSYDERRRLQREIESLEVQAGKGKIPRRRYRVRRMTVEGRVSALSRDLAAFRTKISTAGPRYADLMRQLEVAEAEEQAVMADINRTEIRYRRGEISAAAYHKLLEDYYRRRDRAKTTIDGVLLRLREEIG